MTQTVSFTQDGVKRLQRCVGNLDFCCCHPAVSLCLSSVERRSSDRYSLRMSFVICVLWIYVMALWFVHNWISCGKRFRLKNILNVHSQLTDLKGRSHVHFHLCGLREVLIIIFKVNICIFVTKRCKCRLISDSTVNSSQVKGMNELVCN